MWNRPLNETLPFWYVSVEGPVSSLWRMQRDHLVNAYWLPCMRSLYLGKTVKYAKNWAAVHDAFAVRLQKNIQQEIHVSAKVDKNMKIKAWVNVYLDDEDKEQIGAQEIAVPTMLQEFGNLVFKGYRFSMTYDDYSDAIQVALVCCNPEEENYGYAMSARHPDPEMALRTLAYKWAICAEQPWSERVEKAPAPNWS
jgi:hypothetical protein